MLSSLCTTSAHKGVSCFVSVRVCMRDASMVNSSLAFTRTVRLVGGRSVHSLVSGLFKRELCIHLQTPWSCNRAHTDLK